MHVYLVIFFVVFHAVLPLFLFISAHRPALIRDISPTFQLVQVILMMSFGRPLTYTVPFRPQVHRVLRVTP
jgi:hypothetical protein